MKEMIKDEFRFFVVPADILDDETLSVNEKMVYVVLRSFCSAQDNTAFPSIKKIAHLASVSERTVQRSLDKLIDKGYVQKEQRFTYDHKKKVARQTTNIYTIGLPGGCHTVTGGGVTQSPGGCHTVTGGGVTVTHHEHIQYNHNQSMIDYDVIGQKIYEDEFKKVIDQEKYKEIMERIKKAKPTKNVMKYIRTTLKRETQNIGAAKTNKKPQMNLIDCADDEPPLSQEEIKQLCEMMKSL